MGMLGIAHAEPINIDAIMKTTMDAGMRSVMDDHAIRKWYYQKEVTSGNVTIPSHFHIETAEGLTMIPFVANGSIADTILTQCTMYARYYVTFECNAELLQPNGLLTRINQSLADNEAVQKATYKDLRARLSMLSDKM